MFKNLLFGLVCGLIISCAFAQGKKLPQQKSGPVGCKQSSMLKPSPFMGTENEIIVLADGSVWEDLSYKYLYLYAYQPQVLICPALGKIYVEAAGSTHVFTVQRVN